MKTYGIGDIVYQDKRTTVTVNNFHRVPNRTTLLTMHIGDRQTHAIYEENVPPKRVSDWIRDCVRNHKYPAVHVRVPYARYMHITVRKPRNSKR